MKKCEEHATTAKDLVKIYGADGRVCSNCWNRLSDALSKEDAELLFQTLISEDQKNVLNEKTIHLDWVPFIDSKNTVHWKLSDFSGPMFADLITKAEVEYVHIVEEGRAYWTPHFASDGEYIYAVVMPAEMFFGSKGEFVRPTIIRSKDFFPVKTMKICDEMLTLTLRGIPRKLRAGNPVYRAMAERIEDGD